MSRPRDQNSGQMEKQADGFLEDVPCEPKKGRRKLGQETGTPDNLRQNRTWHVRRKTACPWLRLRKPYWPFSHGKTQTQTVP